MKKLLERGVGFKLSVLVIITFGAGLYFAVDLLPARAMRTFEHVMDAVTAVVTVLAEILFALWLIYGGICFFRDDRKRAQFFRFINSWPLMLSASLCAVACIAWYLTMDMPRSCAWGAYGPVSATAPFLASPARCTETWILAEDGELWLHHIAETRDQTPPTLRPPVPRHAFVSPALDGFTGAHPLSQYSAEKYGGAWATHWFFGFAFNCSQWDRSEGPGWGYKRGWEFFISIPFWVFILPFVVALPLRFRAWRRREIGKCAYCSYNLRAHKPGDKCPECGTLIPSPPSVTITPNERSRSCPPSAPPG